MSATIAYINGHARHPLLGETIIENFHKTYLRYPHADALVSPYQNYRATYTQLWEQINTASRALMAVKIAKGDRVGIWAMNRYEWVIIQYAVCRIGAILVNINPAYKSTELQYVLKQSGVKCLFSDTIFKDNDYRESIEKVRSHCPDLEQVVFFDTDWSVFLKQASQVQNMEVMKLQFQVQFDDPVNIQYTSGTTGFPKGVTLSHHNILNNGFFIGLRLKYTVKDRVCIPVPFFHCFGMVIGNLACTSHGACMVIPGASFDAAQTLQTVQDERCTSLYGVPTMFIAALQLPDFNTYHLQSLRTGVMAGSPCPEEIMRQVKHKMNMHEVTICYGMTETSPVSTQTEVDAPLEKQVSTVGMVHDHLELKIINPDTGGIVDRGIPGELCTRGYSVMLGYWDNEEATRQVVDRAGWMHTGDEAVMDEDGYVSITGRIKDIIIRGGENISPREIEEFLYTHPDILDVQIIGVPDQKMGELIMAWVKLKQGSIQTEENLVAYCKERIAHYKVPKYWKFVNSFPMTASGKVRKVEMRETAVKELGL